MTENEDKLKLPVEYKNFLVWWENFPHNPDAFSREAIAYEAWKARDIERENDTLRRLLARYQDETPIGHQPYLITHQVDDTLG